MDNRIDASESMVNEGILGKKGAERHESVAAKRQLSCRDNLRLNFLREKTRMLTTSPGVYLMKNEEGVIIYVGKAKNLKNRVTSYFRENAANPFQPHGEHLPKVARMVSFVYDYEFIVTPSEYEALILECSLIKQYDPKYNILLKDDKGYYYIKVGPGQYPRITLAMTKEEDGALYMGPYMSGFTVKQAVEEANKVFKLPTCSKRFPAELAKGRPCLNFHIKQCMGLCKGRISEETYGRTIRDAVEYIKGGSADSVERMTGEMNQAAEELDFERAAILRDRIKAIQRAAANISQSIITGQPDTDVIATAGNGEFTCASILIYREGRLMDKAVYFLGEDDSNMLDHFISRYYLMLNPSNFPKELMLESEPADREMLLTLLKERSGKNVAITVPQRGDNLRLIQLAKANAGEYLSFKVGRTAKEIIALEELAKALALPEPPIYIEAYDISNLASQSMVAGMVVFENGRPNKSAYKRFSIKDVAIQNDLACMREVLSRRFIRYLEAQNPEAPKPPDTENTQSEEATPAEGFARLPDLILLDGGKGQVEAVAPILKSMGIEVPLFGMVKDNKHRTRAIAAAGGEISISDKKPAFMLLTRIQDEVHRFAITYQRKVHKKQSFALELTQVPGIGEKKALKLIQSFKTRGDLKAASTEDLAKTAGVNMKIAQELWELLHQFPHIDAQNEAETEGVE